MLAIAAAQPPPTCGCGWGCAATGCIWRCVTPAPGCCGWLPPTLTPRGAAGCGWSSSSPPAGGSTATPTAARSSGGPSSFNHPGEFYPRAVICEARPRRRRSESGWTHRRVACSFPDARPISRQLPLVERDMEATRFAEDRRRGDQHCLAAHVARPPGPRGRPVTTRGPVSVTLSPPPNHAVVDVRPGDLDTATEVDGWLQEYAVSRDPQLREKIVLAYLGLADRLAGRYRTSRGTTPEDLVQTARAGLIVAVDRYDPDHGTPFVPYAVACVVGELKRHLRDTSWRVHVPRPLKEQALRVCRAGDELHQLLGRAPTTTELSGQLGMGEEEVLEGSATMSSRME